MQHRWRMRRRNVMMMVMMRRQVRMCAVVKMAQSTAQWSHVGRWHQVRDGRCTHRRRHVVQIVMIVQVIIRVGLTWRQGAVAIVICRLSIADQILQAQICVWHLIESASVHHWEWIEGWKYLLIWAERLKSVLHTFIADFCCGRHLLWKWKRRRRRRFRVNQSWIWDTMHTHNFYLCSSHMRLSFHTNPQLERGARECLNVNMKFL